MLKSSEYNVLNPLVLPVAVLGTESAPKITGLCSLLRPAHSPTRHAPCTQLDTGPFQATHTPSTHDTPPPDRTRPGGMSTIDEKQLISKRSQRLQEVQAIYSPWFNPLCSYYCFLVVPCWLCWGDRKQFVYIFFPSLSSNLSLSISKLTIRYHWVVRDPPKILKASPTQRE